MAISDTALINKFAEAKAANLPLIVYSNELTTLRAEISRSNEDLADVGEIDFGDVVPDGVVVESFDAGDESEVNTIAEELHRRGVISEIQSSTGRGSMRFSADEVAWIHNLIS